MSMLETGLLPPEVTGKIDAHQHFWRLSRGDYGWLTPALGPIYRDFEEADLAPLLARHGITRTVLVQAAPSEAETDYMLHVARRAGFVVGVVGWTDFDAPHAPERIAARAADPLIRGFRPMVQDLPDDAWMLGEKPTRALQTLQDCGLRLDALVKPRHLPHLVRLVERFPDLPVVIDHGAKPDIARWRPGDPNFRAWASHLRTLAECGCYAKLSGLVTEADPRWTHADLQPYLDVLLDRFGGGRLMWGSDWPVVDLAGGYQAWTEATARLVKPLPLSRQASLFGGAASRFYSLEAAL